MMIFQSGLGFIIACFVMWRALLRGLALTPDAPYVWPSSYIHYNLPTNLGWLKCPEVRPAASFLTSLSRHNETCFSHTTARALKLILYSCDCRVCFTVLFSIQVSTAGVNCPAFCFPSRLSEYTLSQHHPTMISSLCVCLFLISPSVNTNIPYHIIYVVSWVIYVFASKLGFTVWRRSLWYCVYEQWKIQLIWPLTGSASLRVLYHMYASAYRVFNKATGTFPSVGYCRFVIHRCTSTCFFFSGVFACFPISCSASLCLL